MSWSTCGLLHVERVAAAGEVHVVARVGREPVVAGVVDPPERERRAELVPLGRVVVDDVQDHLDPGRVQRPDHHLELADGGLRARVGRVPRVGGEEAQRVVAPVVHQSLVDQEPVVDVIMDRQQLDGRDAQVAAGAGSRPRRPAPRRCPELLGHLRHQLREALDVQLVDERLVPGVSGRRSSPQVNAVSTTAASGANAALSRSSKVRSALGMLELVAEQRVVPVQVAADRLGVRIEQQLVGVEPVALRGS